MTSIERWLVLPPLGLCLGYTLTQMALRPSADAELNKLLKTQNEVLTATVERIGRDERLLTSVGLESAEKTRQQADQIRVLQFQVNKLEDARRRGE